METIRYNVLIIRLAKLNKYNNPEGWQVYENTGILGNIN